MPYVGLNFNELQNWAVRFLTQFFHEFSWRLPQQTTGMLDINPFHNISKSSQWQLRKCYQHDRDKKGRHAQNSDESLLQCPNWFRHIYKDHYSEGKREI
jgi:hypothetical protein